MYQIHYILVMLCIFDRYFTNELGEPTVEPYLTFRPHPRIRVDLYNDTFCFLAVFRIDGKIVVRESFIDNVSDYEERTTKDHNLHFFLFELAT
jgi:hypothetical protein